MKQNSPKTKLTDLAALVVFGVFALCLLLLLLTGADVYGRLVDRGQSSHTRRTAVQYLATRVHQAEQPAVTVEDFCGLDALALGETINGRGYVTLVYCYEGWLWELFAAEGGDFSPEDGQRLTEAEKLSLKLEDGLLSGTLHFADGTSEEIFLYLRAGEVTGP